MTPIILLFVLIGVPILLGIVFRVGAVYLYTSLLVGELLVKYVGDDAAVAVGGFVRGEYSQIVSSLLLLLIPIVVTVIMLRGTMPKSHILVQLPALISTGATLYIFAVPLLTGGVIGAVLESNIGKTVNSSQDIIIAVSGLIVVCTMWLTGRSHKRKHKKHSK